MSKYDSYKDSGIEWIGEIPEHWEIARMANNGFFYKGKGVSKSQISKDGLPVILYGDIYTKYDVYTENLERKIPAEVAANSVEIIEGDLLFTASGETIEEIGKIVCYGGKEVAYAGGDVIIFRQFKWNSKYLSYLFNSYLFQEQKSKRSKGEIVVHVYSTQLRDIHFPIPPTQPEQTAIATYLDRKTAEIDQLIADKKRLVQLYQEEKTALINQAVTKGIDPDVPMKDSGIAWLGEVPAHWEVKKLKYVIKELESGVSVNSIDTGIKKGEFGILKTSCVFDYTFRPEENKLILNDKELSRAKIKPQKGRIIISRMNTPALVGASGYVGKDYDNLFLPDRLWQTVFYENITLNSKFLSFILKSSNFRDLISVLATGTSPSMKNLSQSVFLNIKVSFPSLSEQNQIIHHLEREFERIEVKITKSKKYIDLLTEYRTALISEVVTGKVKVTPAQTPEA